MTDRLNSLVIELERCIYRLQNKPSVTAHDLAEFDEILVELHNEVRNVIELLNSRNGKEGYA